MTDVDDIAVFARSWVPLALEAVKPTGRAYICTGAYPEEMAAYLDVLSRGPLELRNILVWTYRNTLGPSPSHDYKLNWQAIFYLRGHDAPPLQSPLMTEQFSVQDINAPDGRLGDRLHAWQKPDELAERFIRHSTLPGHTVIDPFAGTGAFLAAARAWQGKGAAVTSIRKCWRSARHAVWRCVVRDDVARDLTDSAFDFQRVVWPVVSQWCKTDKSSPWRQSRRATLNTRWTQWPGLMHGRSSTDWDACVVSPVEFSGARSPTTPSRFVGVGSMVQRPSLRSGLTLSTIPMVDGSSPH